MSLRFRCNLHSPQAIYRNVVKMIYALCMHALTRCLRFLRSLCSRAFSVFVSDHNYITCMKIDTLLYSVTIFTSLLTLC